MSYTDKIVSQLKKNIEQFEKQVHVEEVGTVIEIKDGIARLSGLDACQAQEMLEFPGDTFGLALNLEEETVGAVILGEYTHIKEGDTVKRTGRIMSVPVGDALTGRVVDAIGNPVDGKGELKTKEFAPTEKQAPGVMSRTPVNEPMQTGIKSIDALIPVGRGQRELIIGDRQTGKTAIAIDAIINQKGQDVLCVYVAVGQKKSKVARIVKQLEEAGAMEYTTVVVAGASDPAPMSYLAPYTGVTIAEKWAAEGKDVLCVYDDLTKQAVAYREMSLLLRRPPGREAYPGDVFFLHSRLLERACNLNEKYGGGSITALPIIETQAGDISAYIPTNVISITDGQIFLESDLFNKGVRPAVSTGLSVSRVGGSAQTKPMKKVAGSLKLQSAQARELEAFAQFSSDLDEATKKTIERGRRITELFKQPQYAPMVVEEQVASIFALNEGMYDAVDVAAVRKTEASWIQFLRGAKNDVLEKIKKGDWSDETQAALKEALGEFGKASK